MSHRSIYYTIEIWPPPTSFHLPTTVSRTWTKQNVFHEIGHKIKYWCWCKWQTICSLSSVCLKRRSFTGKKYVGTTIILLMYQSAMLHKYKQNVTFNVINTPITYKKEKPMKKQGVGHFSIWGSIFYCSILTPGSLFYAGQYSIWHRNHDWRHIVSCCFHSGSFCKMTHSYGIRKYIFSGTIWKCIQ